MDYKNYINGKWVEAKSGKTFPVENPFNQEIISHVPDSDNHDVNEAVSAANTAYSDWHKMSASERRDLMKELANKSRENANELAKTISMEMGKPFPEALDEIDTVADFLEYYGELARDEVGRIVAPVDRNTMSLVRYESIGVIGCIIPWNYPLALMGWKLAPALAAGNTVVMKPSEITPLSILHWCNVVDSVLPDGVINVITGFGQSAGEPIVNHPDVPVVTFTGSVATGKKIAKFAAENLKKVSLELGGKDPMIICDDADIEIAAQGASWGGFVNAGQVCTSIERVYVFENVMDQFTEAIIEEAKKVVLGDPMKEDTHIGPMASKLQQEKAIEKVNQAIKDGARLLAGGSVPENLDRGYFYQPTVLDNIEPNMEIITEEAFSPVLPIQKVSSIEEAIQWSNDSVYGLGCSIFTNDIDRALTAADDIKSGTVCINSPLMENIAAPFGGMKQSGIGREHGKEALDEFREAKHIFIDYKQESKDWWF
jgi:acyl-CoA reductase-like NAD-dependent aldehyde dehydrogenase